MKAIRVPEVSQGWVESTIKHRIEAEKRDALELQYFKISLMSEAFDNLPPLKVFLGWTPMKEWISKLTQCYIDAEIKKAYSDARYYYLKYWQINGKPAPYISEENWEAMTTESNQILLKRRGRYW